jgi:hypothetical protein
MESLLCVFLSVCGQNILFLDVPDLENALKRISDCSLSETYHRMFDIFL